jgi:D-mannonate dehydratase
MLTTPYPKDPEREYEEIKKRLRIFNDDKEIARYKRIMPGLLAADISVNVMKVTNWLRSGVDRHSEDFALWTKIFESLFDELNFSESYGPGEQMFNDIYDDPYWCWTTKNENDIRAVLNDIAATSVDEEEVVRRVREELEYPFDNIRVIDGFSFLDQKKPFFVEITSPLGRFARINVNGW